jgi:hypothetical protein
LRKQMVSGAERALAAWAKQLIQGQMGSNFWQTLGNHYLPSLAELYQDLPAIIPLGVLSGATMIESSIDFDSLVSRLDGNLTREKFKVWREPAWEDGTLLPICGLKDVLMPWPHCQGVFLKEFDSVTVSDIRDFAEQCLTYMQRTKPVMFKSKLITQYVIVPALASNNIDIDAEAFVRGGELPKFFSTDVPYPILLDLSRRKLHGGDGIGVWEIPKRLASNVLDVGMTHA